MRSNIAQDKEQSMAVSWDEWEVPTQGQPRAEDYAFDLDRTLSAVVAVTARVPTDAFTAETLGTERSGNGVLIREDGIVLTIGYLITEAEEVWLTTVDGRVVPGHVIGIDQNTGFGLVQALDALNVTALKLGDSTRVMPGERVLVGGAGGRTKSVTAKVLARQEFAGYWEYLLEDAFFTAPAHPHWGGTALIGPKGDLLGIGSLQLQHQTPNGKIAPMNMMVPIEFLEPILEQILDQSDRSPSRPWLGVFVSEDDDKVLVVGLAGNGPAKRAGLREGDGILAVDGNAIDSLSGFYRRLWALGDAGVDVPLTLEREGDVFDVRISSGDRRRFLKMPRLH
ncbi:S1C family serine protease [Lichenihabitans psoromatis]|uniref:S1C family serine protease n=2 Tax=Lichenihabitans psoromatis TaxID=2528642 RepID=UPI001FE0434C|nr:S1C family serine protease [Lichenihabitans psoromatis]